MRTYHPKYMLLICTASVIAIYFMSERNARMASPNIYCVLNHESEHNRNAKVIHASQSSMIEIPPRNDCPYQQQIKKHEQKQLRKHKRNKVNVTNDIYDVDGVSLTSGDNKPRKRLRSYDFRRFLVPPGPVTALASFPGAGNTWVRHLLEHLFGVFTGSLYHDDNLSVTFKGEGHMDGHVVAVKTHHAETEVFDRAILLHRDPHAAFVADVNRNLSDNHLGVINDTFFNSEEWDDMVNCYVLRWKEFYDSWLSFKKPVLLLRYEDLQTNLKGQLNRIANFLKLPVTDDRVHFAIDHQEGLFHRGHHPYDYGRIYKGEHQKWLSHAAVYTETLIADRFKSEG